MDRDEHYERLLKQAQQRIAELERKPEAIPPPPKSPSIPPKVSHWMGIAAIVAACGGGAGLSQLLRPAQTDLGPQLDDIREDMKRMAADHREVRDFVRAYVPQQEARSDIIAGVLCRQNGDKPFARDVDCDAVEFESPPLGKTTIRSRAVWPRVDRAP